MAKVNRGLFSSESIECETPQEFFDKLDAEFNFTVDVCASDSNAKCTRYYTKEKDGLSQTWAGRCFMNPPYGRAIAKWMKKAYESRETAEVVVCLVPARTDTRWWHDYAMKASEIRLIKGRLQFLKDGKPIGSAPFPSAVVVFRNDNQQSIVLSTMGNRP